MNANITSRSESSALLDRDLDGNKEEDGDEELDLASRGTNILSHIPLIIPEDVNLSVVGGYGAISDALEQRYHHSELKPTSLPGDKIELPDSTKHILSQGLQQFYDGPYRVTGALTGELWVADLLLVIFLYIPAELSTLCRAGLVCWAWAERVALVPQWAIATPSGYESHNDSLDSFPVSFVTVWTRSQSTSQLKEILLSCAGGGREGRDAFLNATKETVVRFELSKRVKVREDRKLCIFAYLVRPASIVYFATVVGLCWLIGAGLASLHTEGISTPFELGLATFCLSTITAVVIFGTTWYFIQRVKTSPRERIARARMSPAWLSVLCACLPIIVIGTLLIAALVFRVTYLEAILGDTTNPSAVVVPPCEFRPPRTSVVPPLVYQLDPGQWSYVEHQEVRTFNGTNFTLLSSVKSSNSTPTFTMPLFSCAQSCYCFIAVIGNEQFPDWLVSRSSNNELQDGETKTLQKFRSFRTSRFTSTPISPTPFSQQDAQRTSEFLWNTYTIPLISPLPSTPLQFPEAQVLRWRHTLHMVFMVFGGLFLLASTVFLLTPRVQETCAKIWSSVALLTLNSGVMIVVGGVCGFSAPQAETVSMLPDFCLIEKTGALALFVVGLMVTCGLIVLVILSKR